MNFTYLDTLGGISSLILGNEISIEPIHCELGQDWQDFKDELGKFKMEFAKARANMTQNMAAMRNVNEERDVLKMVLDNVKSQGLKETLSKLVDNNESDEGNKALALQCGEAVGRVEAMKKVLLDTNAERYAKFTCFVCMDRLVDLFIDPCGHVVCEPCWFSTRNKETCPGCRTTIHCTRKIFTLS